MLTADLQTGAYSYGTVAGANVRPNGKFDHGSDNWSGSAYHQPWLVVVLVLCWLALWLAGLRWIMRRYAPPR